MGLLQGVSLQLEPGWGFSFIFILKKENMPEQAVCGGITLLSQLPMHLCTSQYKFLLHMTTNLP